MNSFMLLYATFQFKKKSFNHSRNPPTNRKATNHIPGDFFSIVWEINFKLHSHKTLSGFLPRTETREQAWFIGSSLPSTAFEDGSLVYPPCEKRSILFKGLCQEQYRDEHSWPLITQLQTVWGTVEANITKTQKMFTEASKRREKNIATMKLSL